MELKSLFVGQRLLMTALEEDDAQVIAAWYDHPEFGRRFEVTPARPRAVGEIAARILQARDSQEDCLFGFRLRQEPELVGWGGLDGIRWRDRVASLALALAPARWGQRLGGDALQLLLTYAFGELGLHRVQLTVFADNEPAIRLYRRAGFRQEGVYREFLLREGRRIDMLLMGLLAHEWTETQAP
jgi:RimJ/RimL family protein N-acetyltransferase